MFWKLALTRPAASVPDKRSVSLSCAQPVCSSPAAFAWPGEKPAGDCPLSFAESLKLALVLKALLVEGPVGQAFQPDVGLGRRSVMLESLTYDEMHRHRPTGPDGADATPPSRVSSA